MDDFYTFYDGMRTMVQEYLLGGSNMVTSLNYHIFGYDEVRIRDLYNERSIWEGKELFLNSFISPIYNDQSPQVTSEQKGIYTGSISKDNIS